LIAVRLGGVNGSIMFHAFKLNCSTEAFRDGIKEGSLMEILAFFMAQDFKGWWFLLLI
jgi:hypothetical protein